MEFITDIIGYLWKVLVFVGGVTVAIGVFRLVAGGKAHDSQAQEGAIWTIALGAALGAIGLVAGARLIFPTL